jgi:Trypsin-like peptidase domain
MEKILLTIVIVSLLALQGNCQNGFNKETFSSVLLLEKEDSLGKLIPHGTAFTLYNYKQGKYQYVVTCEHVLRNKYIYVRLPLTKDAKATLISQNTKEIIVRGTKWIMDENTIYTRVTLIRDSTVIVNSKLDIAVFKLGTQLSIFSGEDSTNIMNITNNTGIPKSICGSKSTAEIGTEINFLGFPFSIGTSKGYHFSGYFADESNTPLLRTGTLAWKNKESIFLIDAMSYSGNSGGPVFTKINPKTGIPKLIGMVTSHLIDERLGKDAGINIGLASCVWIDDILKLIEDKKF